jgi:hypothetical protein
MRLYENIENNTLKNIFNNRNLNVTLVFSSKDNGLYPIDGFSFTENFDLRISFFDFMLCIRLWCLRLLCGVCA